MLYMVALKKFISHCSQCAELQKHIETVHNGDKTLTHHTKITQDFFR